MPLSKPACSPHHTVLIFQRVVPFLGMVHIILFESINAFIRPSVPSCVSHNFVVINSTVQPSAGPCFFVANTIRDPFLPHFINSHCPCQRKSGQKQKQVQVKDLATSYGSVRSLPRVPATAEVIDFPCTETMPDKVEASLKHLLGAQPPSSPLMVSTVHTNNGE